MRADPDPSRRPVDGPHARPVGPPPSAPPDLEALRLAWEQGPLSPKQAFELSHSLFLLLSMDEPMGHGVPLLTAHETAVKLAVLGVAERSRRQRNLKTVTADLLMGASLFPQDGPPPRVPYESAEPMTLRRAFALVYAVRNDVALMESSFRSVADPGRSWSREDLEDVWIKTCDELQRFLVWEALPRRVVRAAVDAWTRARFRQRWIDFLRAERRRKERPQDPGAPEPAAPPGPELVRARAARELGPRLERLAAMRNPLGRRSRQFKIVRTRKSLRAMLDWLNEEEGRRAELGECLWHLVCFGGRGGFSLRDYCLLMMKELGLTWSKRHTLGISAARRDIAELKELIFDSEEGRAFLGVGLLFGIAGAAPGAQAGAGSSSWTLRAGAERAVALGLVLLLAGLGVHSPSDGAGEADRSADAAAERGASLLPGDRPKRAGSVFPPGQGPDRAGAAAPQTATADAPRTSAGAAAADRRVDRAPPHFDTARNPGGPGRAGRSDLDAGSGPADRIAPRSVERIPPAGLSMAGFTPHGSDPTGLGPWTGPDDGRRGSDPVMGDPAGCTDLWPSEVCAFLQGEARSADADALVDLGHNERDLSIPEPPRAPAFGETECETEHSDLYGERLRVDRILAGGMIRLRLSRDELGCSSSLTLLDRAGRTLRSTVDRGCDGAVDELRVVSRPEPNEELETIFRAEPGLGESAPLQAWESRRRWFGPQGLEEETVCDGESRCDPWALEQSAMESMRRLAEPGGDPVRTRELLRRDSGVVVESVLLDGVTEAVLRRELRMHTDTGRHFASEIDEDGDGKPDLLVRFDWDGERVVREQRWALPDRRDETAGTNLYAGKSPNGGPTLIETIDYGRECPGWLRP